MRHYPIMGHGLGDQHVVVGESLNPECDKLVDNSRGVANECCLIGEREDCICAVADAPTDE